MSARIGVDKEKGTKMKEIENKITAAKIFKRFSGYPKDTEDYIIREINESSGNEGVLQHMLCYWLNLGMPVVERAWGEKHVG